MYAEVAATPISRATARMDKAWSSPCSSSSRRAALVTYDSGYPAALAALARLTDLEREHALPAPAGQGHEVNANGSGSPMPEPMRQAVAALDAPFGIYMDLQSRMRADMRLLSVRERAFITMTVDVLFQTLQESFRAHLTRALAAGAEVRGHVAVQHRLARALLIASAVPGVDLRQGGQSARP